MDQRDVMCDAFFQGYMAAINDCKSGQDNYDAAGSDSPVAYDAGYCAAKAAWQKRAAYAAPCDVSEAYYEWLGRRLDDALDVIAGLNALLLPLVRDEVGDLAIRYFAVKQKAEAAGIDLEAGNGLTPEFEDEGPAAASQFLGERG